MIATPFCREGCAQARSRSGGTSERCGVAGGLSPDLRGGEHFRVQHPVSDPGEWRKGVCHM